MKKWDHFFRIPSSTKNYVEAIYAYESIYIRCSISILNSRVSLFDVVKPLEYLKNISTDDYFLERNRSIFKNIVFESLNKTSIKNDKYSVWDSIINNKRDLKFCENDTIKDTILNIFKILDECYYVHDDKFYK